MLTCLKFLLFSLYTFKPNHLKPSTMKLMTTTNESMESLRSIARSLWRLGIISTILLFSHTLSAQCEWTVHVWGSTWGDEVQWTLKNSSGSTLLSGGNYLSGFDDEQSVMADGPLTF